MYTWTIYFERNMIYVKVQSFLPKVTNKKFKYIINKNTISFIIKKFRKFCSLCLYFKCKCMLHWNLTKAIFLYLQKLLYYNLLCVTCFLYWLQDASTSERNHRRYVANKAFETEVRAKNLKKNINLVRHPTDAFLLWCVGL